MVEREQWKDNMRQDIKQAVGAHVAQQCGESLRTRFGNRRGKGRKNCWASNERACSAHGGTNAFGRKLGSQSLTATMMVRGHPRLLASEAWRCDLDRKKAEEKTEEQAARG